MWVIAAKAIGANLFVAISALGFGTWLARLFPNSLSRLTRISCMVIGGFGLLELILFVIGQISFSRWIVWAVLWVGTASAVAARKQFGKLSVSISKIPATVVGAVLLLTAIAGLAPPIGDWNVDGISYHYVGPKVWLRDGVIRPLPDNAPASYPSLVEVGFAALRAVGGEQAPVFSPVWTLGFFLMISAGIGLRAGLTERSWWWVAALLATMGALYEGSHSGFIDAVYAAFLLAAIHLGLDATEKKHFVAFGFFCGLAIATKYPALVTVPVIVACCVWRGTNEGGVWRAVRNAAVALLVALIAASPFYLRNWILLGSPIYPPPPGAAAYFHVKYFTVDGLKSFYEYAVWRGNGLGRGLFAYLLLPYNLTYHTANFHGGGGIGIAPLAFGWIGVLASWRERFATRLALIGLVLVSLWFVTMQESRYLIPFYGILAVFAALGWESAKGFLGKRGNFFCVLVVGISLAYGFAIMTKSRVSDLHSVFSPSYARHRQEIEIPYWKSFQYVNATPSVTRILFLDRSIPAYYSDKDYVKPFGQWWERLYVEAATPAEILLKINELHPSHVLDVVSAESGFLIPEDSPKYRLVFECPGQRIYEVIYG